MDERRIRFPLSDGNGAELYICERDVLTVKPLETRFGRRLMLTMIGPEGQPVQWVADSPYNRAILKMDGSERMPTHEVEEAPAPRPRFEEDLDDEIPF